MNQPLPSADTQNRRPLAIFGAALLALLLFLLIPLTQELNKNIEQIYDVRQMVTIQPPQITAPPIKDPPKEVEPEPQPEFEQQVQELSLSQLELSLNPGIGDAVKIGIQNSGFATNYNAVSNIKEMFTFSDMEQAPTIINRPRVQFPHKLARRGIKEGRVLALIEIDEKGRASVIRIISSTSPELIISAKSVIRQARFTQPVVNGKPTKVQGEWPIILRAPN